MVSIKQQLASQDVINKRTSGTGNLCNFITIHETGNENKGAGAQTHANLQSRLNPREASWHYQVDDKEIVQSFADDVRCWHAGDGGKGNRESIGIEICVNPDSDFKTAIENAVSLVKHLMTKHEISINNVVQHNKWSGKNCPHFLRCGEKGINWNSFVAQIKEEPKKEIVQVSEVKITDAEQRMLDRMAKAGLIAQKFVPSSKEQLQTFSVLDLMSQKLGVYK